MIKGMAKTKTSIVLTRVPVDLISEVDHLRASIRLKTGKAVYRAQLVRAVLRGLIDSKADFTGCGSESEFAKHVARQLKKAK